MARILRVFAWIFAGLAGLLVLLVVFLLVAPWNWARGPLADRVGGALFRKVQIAGPLNVHLRRTTTIEINDLSIANLDWSKDPQMVRMKTLRISIYLPALLRGTLVLPELTLIGADVILEKNQKGEANWSFRNPAAAVAKQAAVPQKRSEMPVIEHLVIEDGHLVYRDPAKRIDIDTKVSTATGGDPDHRETTLAGGGHLAGMPFNLKMAGGSILALRESKQPYPIRMDAKVGATAFAAEGTMDDPIRMAGFDLQLKISGTDLAEIFPILGIPMPHTRPYSLQGRLQHDGERWDFSKFAGRVGESDLSGDLTVEQGDVRPRMTADFVSHLLDYSDLAGFVGAKPGQPEDPAKARVLPDAQLNPAELQAMDLDVHFRGEQIKAEGLAVDQLNAHLVIKDGRAALDPVSVRLAQGLLGGKILVDGSQTPPAASFDIRLDQMRLERLFANTPFADQMSGVMAGRFEVMGRGASTAEILGRADGHVSLFMGGGRFSALAVSLVGLDVGRTLGILATQDHPLELRCMVADFTLRQGQGRSDAFVFDTEQSAVTGDATINFGEESLALRLTAHPKEMGISAQSDVLAGGSFKHPTIGIDTADVAARGSAAAALGVLLTPLGALLPYIQLGLGEDSPCAQLIAHAQAAPPPPPLDRPRKPAGPRRKR